MMAATRSRRGASGSACDGTSPASLGGAAQHGGPQAVDVAELVLDRAPGGADLLGDPVGRRRAGSPVASARSAASSMASRVAWPRRLGALPGRRCTRPSPDRIRRILTFTEPTVILGRMAKPPLSMKPTGWFQVAWSDEVGVGDVHTMKYFGES